MSQKPEAYNWFERRRLTLNLAGLSEEQLKEGSIFLGGSAAQYVVPKDKFEFKNVSTVVFRWGDPKAEDMFAAILEHGDNPDPDHLISFSATTVISDQIWMLALQDKSFDPETAYRSVEDYKEIPFDTDSGETTLREFIALIPTHIQLIGRVGTRWVLFEMGMSLEGDVT